MRGDFMRFLIPIMVILIAGCIGPGYCGDGICQLNEQGHCDEDCAGSADLIIDSFIMDPPPETYSTSLGDFKITPVVKGKDIESGQQFHYEVQIKDDRGSDVDECERKAYFYSMGVEYDDCWFEELDTGKYEITVKVDTKDQIHEADETNNRYQRRVTLSNSPIIEEDIGIFRYDDTQRDDDCNIVDEGSCEFYTGEYDKAMVGVEIHKTTLTNDGLKEELESMLEYEDQIEIDLRNIEGSLIYHLHDDDAAMYVWRTKTALVVIALNEYDNLKNLDILELVTAYTDKYPSTLQDLELQLCSREGNNAYRVCCDGLDRLSVEINGNFNFICADLSKGTVECRNGNRGDGLYYSSGEFIKSRYCGTSDDECSDSDGGTAPNVYGIVTYGNRKAQDMCDGDILIEQRCCRGGICESEIECENGCSGGRCNADATSCKDTDNGLDFHTKGSAYGMLPETGEYGTSYDRCDGDRLYEANCRYSEHLGDEARHLYSYLCPNGCNDGACIADTSCTDTDGGIEYFTKGNTLVRSGTGVGSMEDYCQGDTLVESYCCDDGKSCRRSYVCPNGCDDGACKQQELPCGELAEYTHTSDGVRDCCDGLYAYNLNGASISIDGSLCVDRSREFPRCLKVGTPDEGWYYWTSGELVAYADCDKVDYPCRDTDGSPDFLVDRIDHPINPRTSPSLFVKGTGEGQYAGSSLRYPIIVGVGDEPTDSTNSPYPYSKYTDYCRGNQLNEAYCHEDGRLGAMGLTCPDGCVDGACVNPDDICYKSDEGRDPYTKGYVQEGDGEIAWDYCDGSTLQEWECVDNEAVRYPMYCPNGCNDGVCNNQSSCHDTDGENPYTMGAVQVGNGMPASDYCNDENSVWERICHDGTASKTLLNCPHGCEAGACIDDSALCTMEGGRDYCLEITNPTGGETFYSGSTMSIDWVSKDIDMITIGYKTCDSCLDWIVNNHRIDIDSEDGSYEWEIPDRLSGREDVRIAITAYQVGEGSVSVLSDYFDIRQEDQTQPVGPHWVQTGPPHTAWNNCDIECGDRGMVCAPVGCGDFSTTYGGNVFSGGEMLVMDVTYGNGTYVNHYDCENDWGAMGDDRDNFCCCTRNSSTAGFQETDSFDFWEDQSSHDYETVGYTSKGAYNCGSDDSLRIGDCSNGGGSVYITVAVDEGVDTVILEFQEATCNYGTESNLEVQADDTYFGGFTASPDIDVCRGQAEGFCRKGNKTLEGISHLTDDGELRLRLSDPEPGLCTGDPQLTYLKVYS